MSGIPARVILTVALFILVGLANSFLAPASTLLLGQVAGMQFVNSDTAYIASSVGMWLGARMMVSFWVVLLGLAAIWTGPILRAWRASATLALLLAIGGLSATPAQAYYDKSDYTEAITIYPNETAFWVPDTGANKDTQAKFDSADYYQANRIAAKRFLIPHSILQGSGTFSNFYVPAGRLILVDRTPYNQEWVHSHERGSSQRDESFPCQDNQGHDVTVEITIGTSVSEINAAQFLYFFGVKPPAGDRTKPEVIFTSVYYGRSLAEVMPTVGRGIVQALVCSQISARDLDHVNLEASAMLSEIQTKAAKAFADRGITLDYLGWAGTFSFSDGIQSAIDRRYIAEQDQKIAQQLQPYTDVIQALAAAEAIRSFGAHTDGKLPSTIVGLPTNLGSLLGNLLTARTAAPATH